MSTPQHQQQQTKAPRRSARKQNNTPNGPNPRAAVSDNELSHPTQTSVDGDAVHGRRKSHASNKKANGIPHRGSVSDSVQPMKTHATPIKQAYAGPTFHQSPAASALPIPSFYSKSVPNATAQSVQAIPESVEDEKRAGTPGHDTPTKRESTPLDFLFQAARQARDTPRGESPSANSGHISVRTGSPASKSPAPKESDSMFPFELDGASTPGADGASFSTPYKDRIEALKSSRPSSENSQHMDETERRAKTDALKRLLMKNSAPQNPSNVDHSNPFNARPPYSPNHMTPPPPQIRQRSGPSTPSYMQTYNGTTQGDQYFQQMPPFPRDDFNHYTSARVASNLRNVYGAVNEPEPAELSSDSAISPPRISTARNSSYPDPAAPVVLPGTTGLMTDQRPPMHKSNPSVQQMEDDLRRVLKLDLTSRG